MRPHPPRPAAPGAARWLRAPLVCLALAACDGGASDQAAAPPRPPPAVGVMAVASGDVQRTAEFLGRVEAVDKVEIRARVSGFLEKRAFAEGETVQAGDLLFVIEDDQYAAQVQQAKASVAQAKAKALNASLALARAAQLVERGNIPRATYDERVAEDAVAKADIAAAEASLREAELNLGYTQVKAPVAGRIGRAAYTVGNLVGPDAGVLATLVSRDPIYVTFPVSQREILEFQRRAAAGAADQASVIVHVQLSDNSEYEHPGKIDFLDVQVAEGTDTVTVRARFPNPEGLLVDGQFVSVAVAGDKPKPALVVPAAALQIDQAGPFVLVVNQENKVEARRVRTGPRQGTDIAVEDGLREGERIVVEGIQKVRPGRVVDPAPVAPAASAGAGG